jgi:hypothetical protein
MIGNFMRQAIPPVLDLPEENTEGWYVVKHQQLLSFPHGMAGSHVLQQLSYDYAETLREYTQDSQNLLAYKRRLQILYRLIGEISLTARASNRGFCIIFLTLPLNNMKILNELVAAHGSQLRRCTNRARAHSWGLFLGTEELADNNRIDDAVTRAVALTAHGP